ncbi:MAG: UDP-N-acetylmuramoyl-L-alanine--D-glutamate ligase [Betaproteobacteria bacterium]|nr:UDP-N-acetylmuramoyl-L-alanine--D-glutamate ligase [Betaproteobacteria bacterium]
MSLDGKNVLVLGLGESGLSMARWAARTGAARVCVADTRAEPPGRAALAQHVPQAILRTGAFERDAFAGIDLVAISPGVPLAEPTVRDASARGVPVVGDVEIFSNALKDVYRDRATPTLIGVTGTNGKTTVTALTNATVAGGKRRTEMAGNISPAVLTALMDCIDRDALPEVWVLELSSYQLESTYSLNLDAATMLNLSEDHLDRYANLDAYAAAKARIFAGDGLQVLNRNDPMSLAMQRADRGVTTFGLDEAPTDQDYGLIRAGGSFQLAHGRTPVLAATALQLAGLHNAANALAALALTSEIDLDRTGALNAMRAFRGLPHRVEPVAEVDGVRYFNDSKGTNVGATIAALDGFARSLAGTTARVVLIAGGDGKGQNFTPLRDALGGAVRAVILIGRDGPVIDRALAGSSVARIKALSMADAIDRAREMAVAGDIVLLSPACASFDMFNHYKHRGEVFSAIVKGLPNAHGN